MHDVGWGMSCFGSTVALVAAMAGCDEPTPTPHAESQATPAVSASAAASARDAASSGPSAAVADKAPAQKAALGVTCDQWEAWKGYAPDCSFQYAAAAASQPSPLKWGACPDALAGGGCRALRSDDVESYVRGLNVARDGSGWLLADAGLDWPCDAGVKARVSFVARLADGAVASAIAGSTEGYGCSLRSTAMGGANGLVTILGNKRQEQEDDTGFPPAGAIVGLSGQSRTPQLLKTWSAGVHFTQTMAASPRRWGFAHKGALWLHAFGRKDSELEHQGDAVLALLPVSEGALWIEGAAAGELMAWSAGGEPHRLAGIDGDVIAVGTDAEQIVVTVKRSDAGAALHCDVVVAPFTLGDALAVPRVVGSIPCDAPTRDLVTWTVGCGYAAHRLDISDRKGSLFLKLDDGRRWTVPHRVLGVSCKEVFAVPSHPLAPKTALLALKLDALGPGEARTPVTPK